MTPGRTALSWEDMPPLQLLRRMYAVVDASVDMALRHARLPLACGAGCAHCCAQPVPATPLEILGIQLALRHGSPEAALQALLDAPNTGQCFFVDAQGRCAIYSHRPIACRRYLVCVRRCAPGEMPTTTRPQHMLEPERSALLRALRISSPYYVESGLLPTPPQTMQDFARVTVLLSAVAWRDEVAHCLKRRNEKAG